MNTLLAYLSLQLAVWVLFFLFADGFRGWAEVVDASSARLKRNKEINQRTLLPYRRVVLLRYLHDLLTDHAASTMKVEVDLCSFICLNDYYYSSAHARPGAEKEHAVPLDVPHQSHHRTPVLLHRSLHCRFGSPVSRTRLRHDRTHLHSLGSRLHFPLHSHWETHHQMGFIDILIQEGEEVYSVPAVESPSP